MLRKLMLPALAALAITAGTGEASAKTYWDFSIGIGTPFYGTPYYGPNYRPNFQPYVPYRPYGFPYRPGFAPYPYAHCGPVIVGYRKVWSERRHRWVRRAVTRIRCY